MENKNVVTKKEDVVVRSSDFVIQHTQKSTFANHYTLDPHILGEGAFGIVQKCFKKGTLEERAVKRIEKSKMNDQEKVRLQYEVNILKNLNHPNIVRLHEVFEETKYIWLVTELCEGRELFDEIQTRKKFTELEAAIVTKQILSAISYCHEK